MKLNHLNSKTKESDHFIIPMNSFPKVENSYIRILSLSICSLYSHYIERKEYVTINLICLKVFLCRIRNLPMLIITKSLDGNIKNLRGYTYVWEGYKMVSQNI